MNIKNYKRYIRAEYLSKNRSNFFEQIFIFYSKYFISNVFYRQNFFLYLFIFFCIYISMIYIVDIKNFIQYSEKESPIFRKYLFFFRVYIL